MVKFQLYDRTSSIVLHCVTSSERQLQFGLLFWHEVKIFFFQEMPDDNVNMGSPKRSEKEMDPNDVKKEEFIKQFLTMKAELTAEGDRMHQQMIKYNAKVRLANEVRFKYQQLLSFEEPCAIGELQNYHLTRNKPAGSGRGSGNKRHRKS